MAEMIIALCVAAAVLALLDGALSDLRAFRIPNRVPVVLVVGFLAAVTAGFEPASWHLHLMAGGLCFVAGAIMFFTGVWGGGDAKMLPAAALWVGIGALPRFLLVMAVTGGCLALLAIASRRVPFGPVPGVRRWGVRMASSGKVPYGVAIAAAGLDGLILNLLAG